MTAPDQFQILNIIFTPVLANSLDFLNGKLLWCSRQNLRSSMHRCLQLALRSLHMQRHPSHLLHILPFLCCCLQATASYDDHIANSTNTNHQKHCCTSTMEIPNFFFSCNVLLQMPAYIVHTTTKLRLNNDVIDSKNLKVW